MALSAQETRGTVIPGAVTDLDGRPVTAGTASVTTAVAAGTAANTVIKATPGRIGRLLITTTGSNPMQIFDNATTGSGTVIGATPANPAVGTTYDFNLPAAAGITVLGNAANPAFTLSWN